MLTLRALFMYFIVTVIVTYPLIFHLNEFVTNPIDPLLYVWNLHHNFLAMIGQRNFLDTNMFYPTTNTIAYSDHLFGQSILLFPLFFFIKNSLVIQNFYILSTFVLSALGVYLLSFHFTKKFWPSFTAGILYSFSLYHLDHLGQVPTTSIQWIPFIFLYLFKSVETKRSRDILLFWVFFTLNFLSTLYFGLFVTIPIGIFFMFYNESWRVIKKILIIGTPFIFILLASAYPYIVFRLENPGVIRSIDESAARSARLFDYFIPRIIHDRSLFPGVFTLLFTGVALTKIRKRKEVLFFGIVMLVAVVLSLGPYYKTFPLPYLFLYKFIPVFQAIRVPARFGVIAIFAFSMLAGFGMKLALDRINDTVWKKWLIVGILLFVSWELVEHKITFATVPTLAEAPPVYSWLKERKEVRILELPLRHAYNSNPIEQQVHLTYDEITEFDNFVAETFRLYFSTIHGQKMANGYSSYFPTTYQDLATAMETFPAPYSIELIEQRGITHIILHKRQYGQRLEEIILQLEQNTKLTKVQEFETELVYEVR